MQKLIQKKLTAHSMQMAGASKYTAVLDKEYISC